MARSFSLMLGDAESLLLCEGYTYVFRPLSLHTWSEFLQYGDQL